ncbi:hypothetical protein FKM82_003089 [Ascaphus truei]
MFRFPNVVKLYSKKIKITTSKFLNILEDFPLLHPSQQKRTCWKLVVTVIGNPKPCRMKKMFHTKHNYFAKIQLTNYYSRYYTVVLLALH